MCFQRTYLDIRNRGKISTGSVIAFEKMPFTGIKKLADFGGWMSNWGIYFKQRPCDIDNRGFKNFVHVAIVLRNPVDDVVMGLEYTAGMKGLTPFRLSDRIKAYTARGGRVAWFPLQRTAQARLNTEYVGEWIKAHREDTYNYKGLPFAEMHHLPLTGRKTPGKLFCSEGVMRFWADLGIISPKHRTWHGEFRDEPIKPWLYSPQEVLGHEVIDRDRACEVVL